LGIVIGSAIMRVIDNGINMFQLPYVDHEGIQRIWRLNPNSTFVIIGAVILVAVVLDQVVHIVQAKRRIRRAGAAQGATPAAEAGQPSAAAASASDESDDNTGPPKSAESTSSSVRNAG